MRIRVEGDGHNLNLVLPTRLIFSKTSCRIANFFGRKYAADALKDIPPEAMEAIFAELSRIKQKHRRWELVEVTSAGGETVKVTL